MNDMVELYLSYLIKVDGLTLAVFKSTLIGISDRWVIRI